jgi:predicted enzyme related to lactoylglutathione lyase
MQKKAMIIPITGNIFPHGGRLEIIIRRMIRMKKMLQKSVGAVTALVLIGGLAACGSPAQTTLSDNETPTAQTEAGSGVASNQTGQPVAGLPDGFPKEVPIFADGQVIDADNFNGNHYMILYSVNEDFNKVADFYKDAFDLDDSGMGDGEAYYEGIDFGELLIQGLTVEEAQDEVNVYITLEDNRQEIDVPQGEAGDQSEEYSADSSASDNSNIMTYDNAQVVNLDDNYPQDVVPFYSDAKVIGCSIVPGSSSGFVELILPAASFDDAVAFYTNKLGITPKDSTTVVQEAAEFKGEIDNFKVTLLISHLQSDGNDTLVQITVNEK